MDMHPKLKYGLPLAQMALALALLLSAQRWDRAMMRLYDMPGPSPAFTLLVSINAPVGLARIFWFRYVPDPWDWVTFIAAVGLFWYWAALNVQSWREARMVYMFTSNPLRIAGDLLLIAIGASLGFFFLAHELWIALRDGVQVARISSPPFTWPSWLWFGVIAGLHLAWSVVLLFFFGRDLLHCLVRRNHITTRPSTRTTIV